MSKVNLAFLSLITAVLVGCGPTDATINSSVQQKFASDDAVKVATINATTQKKVVTLTGTVDSQDTKDRAATVARQADGVSDVVNQITVTKRGEGPGSAPGMTNGMGQSGGMGSRGMGSGNMGQGSGGMSGGQGSGGSGQAGGQGSGGSPQSPAPMKHE